MFPGRSETIVATVEARMRSSRLPGKVLLELAGEPVLLFLVERLRRSRYVDEVVVATTVHPDDDAIERTCMQKKVACFRGSEEDVLRRVLDAARTNRGQLIVEITGDCPFVDPAHVDEMIEMFYSGDYDYVSNMGNRPYPVGFEVQVFPTAVLEKVNELTQNPADHEHVSLYIYTHPELFRVAHREAHDDMYHPDIEVTLDTGEDYRLLRDIAQELHPRNPHFSAGDVVRLLRQHPEWIERSRSGERKYAADFLEERMRHEEPGK
ncbi:MAG TPA: glycosyltransferase family protein [Thermotogota bacterium]|nr:glycosyltransferase family protein [Thermotogota bacterium]HRW91999.1 glycosyltransferase family protein [Thermotogota bacterium]